MGAYYENMLGTLVMGIFFNTYLYGIVCVQYLDYTSRSKFKDSRTIKSGISLLFINDSFQSVSMIYMAWFYCIEKFAVPSVVDDTIWSYAYVPIGTALTALITHLAMVYRIFCISKNVMLYGGLVLASVCSFATGIASGIRIWILPNISTHTSLRTLIAWWLGIQAALDIVIAALLIALLQKQRTEDHASRTNSVINRLIRGAGQTGLLPVLFAFSALVAFLVRRNSNLYIMFIIPIGRTYTTSFMDGLNVRESLKERLLGNREVIGQGVTSEIVWRNPTKSVMAVQVSIDQTHHQDIEAQKVDSLPDHVPAGHSKPSLDRPLPTVVIHPPSDAES